jgi:hypothetical protein
MLTKIPHSLRFLGWRQCATPLTIAVVWNVSSWPRTAGAFLDALPASSLHAAMAFSNARRGSTTYHESSWPSRARNSHELLGEPSVVVGLDSGASRWSDQVTNDGRSGGSTTQLTLGTQAASSELFVVTEEVTGVRECQRLTFPAAFFLRENIEQKRQATLQFLNTYMLSLLNASHWSEYI